MRTLLLITLAGFLLGCGDDSGTEETTGSEEVSGTETTEEEGDEAGEAEETSTEKETVIEPAETASEIKTDDDNLKNYEKPFYLLLYPNYEWADLIISVFEFAYLIVTVNT